MLNTRVRVYQNPWGHTVTDKQLVEIMTMIADKRAEHIEHQFEAGVYKRNSFGLCILDPSAPLQRSSSKTLLATITIGDHGESFIPNAIAKAVQHRDHDQTTGHGVYVDLTTTSDGDFCYGYSSKVDNTIGGGSGATELQDACEVAHALATFNYLIRAVRKDWLDAHKGNRWFCNQDESGARYEEMANRPKPVFDSDLD